MNKTNFKFTKNNFKSHKAGGKQITFNAERKALNWYNLDNMSRIKILSAKARKGYNVNTIEEKELLEKSLNVKCTVSEVRDNHPHFLLGLSRRILEESVSLGQSTMIYDIGCGTRSLGQGLEHVHNNRPVIDVADKIRYQKLKLKLNEIPQQNRSKYDKLICTCKVGLEQCPHISRLGDTVTLLTVDSSYYPGVMNFIAEQLTKSNVEGCYAIFHVFNTEIRSSDIVIGSNIEGNYEIFENTVHFESRGNGIKYVHPLHILNDLFYKNAMEITVGNVFLTAVVQRRICFKNNHYILCRIDTTTVEDNLVNSKYLGFEPKAIVKPKYTQLSRALPKITEEYNNYELDSGSYLRIPEGDKYIIYKKVAGKIKSAQVYKTDVGYLWDDQIIRHVTEELQYNDLISVNKINRLINQLIVKKEINRQIIAEAIAKLLLQDDHDLQHVIAIVESALKTTLNLLIAAEQLKESDTVKNFNAIKADLVKITEDIDQEKGIVAKTIEMAQEGLNQCINLLAKPFEAYGRLNNDEMQFNLLPTYNEDSFVSCNDFDDQFYTLQKEIAKLSETTYVSLPRQIGNSCISSDNYKDVSNTLDLDTKWALTLPELPSLDEFLSLKCIEENTKPGLKQILPVIKGAPEPIIYENCLANAYCAIKRQATEVPQLDPEMLKVFEKWVEEVINTELKPALDNFEYSYQDWYNHLSASQQKEIDRLDPNNIECSNKWNMFCKREKQLYEKNGKAPKNRCICCPGPEHKFAIGPVTFALETVMKDHLKGYCGGKNWDDLEDYYNEMKERGFTKTVQLDGSGFDRTQHQAIKNVVDWKIYQLVENKIYHCKLEDFKFYAYPTKRRVELITREKVGKNCKVHRFGKIIQEGKVFTGSMDTTLMNTVRMALYNRFVIEHFYGLTPNQYGLLCKGDDSAAFFQTTVDEVKMDNCYLQVFTKGTKGMHGLGQTAKFLKWGDIEDIDFCSTETFWADSIQSYKITRKLDRFLTLSAWSRKAVNLSEDELRLYKKSQYYSNLCWMKNLPIYRVYNQALNVNTEGLTFTSKNGEIKQHITEDNYQDLPFKFFDKDDLYKMERKSKKVPSSDDYFNFLERRYKVSRSEVLQAEYDIYNALVSKSGEIDSPVLLQLINTE